MLGNKQKIGAEDTIPMNKEGFVCRSFLKGQKIFLQNIAGETDIWFIEKGNISIKLYCQNGRSLNILNLKGNQWGIPLIYLKCVVKKGYVLSALFTEDTRVWSIPVKNLSDSKNCRYYNLFYMDDRGIGKIISMLADAYSLSIKTRLYMNLAERSKRTKSISIYVTHEQLANEIGTSREVISRTMKELEKDGKLYRERGKIHLIKENKTDSYEYKQ